MNFWSVGAIASGVIAYLMLNTLSLPSAVSWRYGFALGGVLALVVLLFRRKVPESPRWLVAQGRFEEAEKIVARLERSAGVTAEAAQEPVPAVAQPGGSAREAVVALVRRHPGRLALGCLLDLSEAFGFYGIFAVLSIVVLKRLGYSDGEIPFFFILGNVGGLLGGIVMTLGFERIGRRGTVGLYYGAAAASIGVLAAATESGGKTATLLAFMLSCACATGAWTAAYPTFTELFPTHLRAAGVGISVGVGRIGAAFGTLYLPDIAERLGPTPSYLLIAAFWAVGLVAIVVWSLAGGVEAARQPLEVISPTPHEPGAAAPPAPLPAEG
jgi:MFS family permease